MMSTSRRRGELNPKLHMDRQPTVARITDPSLPAGKRREIDNVMKKARANTNDYWDKKLLEAEEKDPNRWRHTGYKKMYIQGESSSGESDRDRDRDRDRDHVGGGGGGGGGPMGGYRYASGGGGGGSGVGGPAPGSSSIGSGRYGRSRSRSPRSRSHSRLRKSPPLSPMMGSRRRTPPPLQALDSHSRRMSPPLSMEGRGRPRSPPMRGNGMPPRSPSDSGSSRRPMGVGGGGGRPRSPPEPPMRRKTSRSPPPMSRRRSPAPGGIPPGGGSRRRSPLPASGSGSSAMMAKQRGQILPRSKRPPSPPPRSSCRSRSNSSVSSCTDDSCSMCSPKHRHRSRSSSLQRVRMTQGGGPRSPPNPKSSRSHQYRNGAPLGPPMGGGGGISSSSSSSRLHGGRPVTPPPSRGHDKYREEKMLRRVSSRERSLGGVSSDGMGKGSRSGRRSPPPEDPRLKGRAPPEPLEPATSAVPVPAKKKKKDKEVAPHPHQDRGREAQGEAQLLVGLGRFGRLGQRQLAADLYGHHAADAVRALRQDGPVEPGSQQHGEHAHHQGFGRRRFEGDDRGGPGVAAAPLLVFAGTRWPLPRGVGDHGAVGHALVGRCACALRVLQESRLFARFGLEGLHQMGGVVVQIPGVAEAGALLRVLGAPADASPSQEVAHHAATELRYSNGAAAAAEAASSTGKQHGRTQSVVDLTYVTYGLLITIIFGVHL